jgi:hypothetical protein
MIFICSAHHVLISQSYIAPKFGINGVAQYAKEDGLNFQTNRGFQFGGEIGTKWKNIIGVRAELLYANQAFTQTRQRIAQNNNQNFFDEVINIKNGSIQVNGAILITLGDGFELAVGPQLNLITSSTGAGIWDNGTDSTKVEYDYQNDGAGEGGYWAYQEKDGNYFNQMNLGINLGIGIRLIGNLYLDLRTNYALNDLVNDFYLDDAFKSTKKFDFIVNASYRIPLKKKRKNTTELPGIEAQ